MDSGKDIFFSPHDPQAEYAAKRYAEKKWGQRIILEKGHIMFQPERELERQSHESKLSERKKGLWR
ncbi:hypothetical protein LJC09_03125 [Desulfovibrio sp. OttesenSCG-928-F20]|nr:hypothetical protein [Desulfovibrio sp. OttesenSCG-928-F20]